MPVPQPMFTRRQVLKTGLLAAGGLLTGVGVASVQPRHPERYRKLQVLGAYQAEVTRAFGEAILPAEAGFPTMDEANVIPRLDEELFFVDPSIQSDFKAALMLIELLPFRFGYMSRFSRMPRAQRVDVLRRAQASGVEIANVVVVAAAVMVRYLYYGSEKTWAAVGYDGPFGGLPEKPSEQRQYYQRLTKERS
jgi:hypothetical protein